MSNQEAIKAWKETLEEYCHCYADAVGNRPCDNGAVCDRCMTQDVQEVYKAKLRRAV